MKDHSNGSGRDAILEMRQVTKVYGRAPAIEHIDFTLLRGEVHALLGENGAGKSTLTKVIAGVVSPTSGLMLLEGNELVLKTPSEALKAGIAMVFQETSLVQSMTVAQNLFLGKESFFNRMRGVNIAAQQFMQSLSFQVDPTLLVGTLGAAKKQMVEIARAMLQQAKIIVFDEPTASLTPEEKRHFFDLVATLKKRGVSVIFISHALEEALAIADRITVLRDGRHVLTDITPNLDRTKIVQAMVGRDLSQELYGTRKTFVRPAGKRVLSVQNLRVGNMEEQLALGFRGADHGRLRPRWLGPHRDVQGRRGRDQARLQPWRRSLPRWQGRALPRPGTGDSRWRRVHHRRPQGGGVFRDHVDQVEHLYRPAGEDALRPLLAARR
jgi:ABC-type sugar transport system ATPase subunit